VKLAVINERESDDVIRIVPFDVMNLEEVDAFRRAIEESEVVSSENEESVSVEVKVLTRSQARVEAD